MAKQNITLGSVVGYVTALKGGMKQMEKECKINKPTLGKWEVNILGQAVAVRCEPKCICLFMNNDLDKKSNARLIVEAVNACQEINPSNPLVVAQNIKGMYEALRHIRTLNAEYTSSTPANEKFRSSTINLIREVLTAIERKE